MHRRPPPGPPRTHSVVLILVAAFALGSLLMLPAFLLGVLADRHGWLPGAPAAAPRHLGHTFDPFWEAWNLVEDYYVDREAVDPEKMTRGAIEGMLAALGDEGHTAYLSPDDYAEMENDLNGEMEGIGVRITERQRRPTVASVVPGSPAQAAGLRAGDVLLQVNDRDVLDLSLERLTTLVRGPAGTEVKLQVGREGEAKPLDVHVTRAKIERPDVTWHMLPGTAVAHVAIQSFGQHVHDQLKEALDGAKEKGAKGLLLDLRGNPGGFKDQAVSVASEFLAGGNVFLEQDAAGVRTPVPVEPGGRATEIPLCVLVDEGTASSAEIFAGAVQDHDRGKLVGTRTYGTGTVLEPFQLKDGSAVLLAVAQWFTPKGRQIWHKGIDPDVEATLPDGASVLLPETAVGLDADGLAKSDDKQLLRALELLREQMR